MSTARWGLWSAMLAGVLVVGLLAAAHTQPARANEVLTWNETTLKVVAAGGQNPFQIQRTLAMVHGAVHDALNAINRRYAAYFFEELGDPGASPDAAVATAAHTVLVGVVPNFGTPAQKVAAHAIAEEAYMAALSHGSDGPAKTQGVAVGRAAGAAMLALRQDDGATRDAPYTPGTGPGKWRPHPNPDPPNPPIANAELARGYASAVLPGWGNVTPFTLLSAAQFWLPGPPALTREAYARDYNEIKRLGGQVSQERMAEQTEIARFWFEGVPAWHRIARGVAVKQGLDAWDSARLLGLMSLAIVDGNIAGFKVRSMYDFWRPVTAIREGATDGNDATAGDPSWNSLQNTPPTADYPSALSITSGGGSRDARGRPGHRPGLLLGHEWPAFPRYHALVHELLAGGTGGCGFSHLRRYPLPHVMRGRARAGAQGWTAGASALPPTGPEVTASSKFRA